MSTVTVLSSFRQKYKFEHYIFVIKGTVQVQKARKSLPMSTMTVLSRAPLGPPEMPSKRTGA